MTKQERVRRAYSRKEKEREEFQAVQCEAEIQSGHVDQKDLAVTDELLEEIDELLANPEAIDALSFRQKGGQ